MPISHLQRKLQGVLTGSVLRWPLCSWLAPQPAAQSVASSMPIEKALTPHWPMLVLISKPSYRWRISSFTFSSIWSIGQQPPQPWCLLPLRRKYLSISG